MTRLRRVGQTDASTTFVGARFAPGDTDALTGQPAGRLYFSRQWPDIAPRDRLIIRGGLYEITSNPDDWRGDIAGGLVVDVVRFGQQNVTRWRAPIVNDHGTAVRDWDNATSAPFAHPVSVLPRGGSVDLINRYGVTTRLVVIAQIGEDVVDTDRIEYDGDIYRIDGSVQRFESGIRDHLEIPLTDTEG